MSFKEWFKLQEVGTSTASVAPFIRPLFGGPVTRMYPDPVTIEIDPFFKKKKNSRLDQKSDIK